MTRFMTVEEACKRDWPKVEVGGVYTFYAEMMQEYEPPEQRMRNYTGQEVKVEECLWPGEDEDEGTSARFRVRARDGFEFEAMEEELNGWDKALGQFYGPSGIWGKED